MTGAQCDALSLVLVVANRLGDFSHEQLAELVEACADDSGPPLWRRKLRIARNLLLAAQGDAA